MPKGFTFLLPDDPNQPEVFIYERDLNGAMHRDGVMARINQRHHRGSRKVKLYVRSNVPIMRVGTYRKKEHTQVIPMIPGCLPHHARRSTEVVDEGQKVVVGITSQPEQDRLAEAGITEVMGSKGDRE